MPTSKRRIARLIPEERLQRVLGLSRRAASMSTSTKMALLFGMLALISLLVALYDPRPSLRHVRVAFLSGSPTGNYFATVDKLAAETARRKGHIVNVASAGSVENIERLVAAKATCDIQFALVQDGVDWPSGQPMELIGRLPRPEALIFLGRDADRIKSPQDLRGLRLGIGPPGSGTENLARRVLAPLTELDLKVSTHPIDRQLDMLERGELDLGAMVIDENAQLVVDAVRRRKLQILNIPGAAALAQRLPFARVGQIEAGRYDYVGNVPEQDKQVLHVDTLVIGNGCASPSVTQGLMTAISEVFPTFVRHNREDENLTGIPLSKAARSYFDNQGPDLIGEYAPWIVDILPTATWVQLIIGLSTLFAAMAVGHRFQLWRLDVARVSIEREIPTLFHPGITVDEIIEMPATERHRTPEARAKLNDIVERLAVLSDRCRRHSLSILVPMGQEMPYRAQERIISDLLFALRTFRERLQK
jgi:TRAP-type uncharacterized transport system substrate-binding protein